jgi:hypothetical protein
MQLPERPHREHSYVTEVVLAVGEAEVREPSQGCFEGQDLLEAAQICPGSLMFAKGESQVPP